MRKEKSGVPTMNDELAISAEYLLSRLPSDTSTATGANSARAEIRAYLKSRDTRIRDEESRRIYNAAFDADHIEGATFLGPEEDMSGQDFESMLLVPSSAFRFTEILK